MLNALEEKAFPAMDMFENGVAVLDWMAIVAFAVTGALVASRNQMDAIGFMLLGTVTGIGGGTIRDILLDIHPVLWVEQPQYLLVCMSVSLAVFFLAHLVDSRMRLILWVDAIGLALYAAVGAERAIANDAPAIVAVVMGVITASFGGVIRDLLGQERSIIFSHEIYVTAAMATAATFVIFHYAGLPREIGISVAVLVGVILRGGALLWGWTLPRYHPRPARSSLAECTGGDGKPGDD